MTIADTYAPIRLVRTDNLDRDDWLEWRRQGIGASDIAGVLGMSRWTSPLAVWLDKLGQLPEADIGEPGIWGLQFEDPIAREWARRRDVHVARAPWLLQHPDYEFLICNLDFVVGEHPAVGLEDADGIVEIKTTGPDHAWQWEDGAYGDGGNAPDYYVLQVQHQLAVTGFARAWLVCLIGNRKLVTVEIERDDELIAMVTRAAGEFWELVEAETPPAADGTDQSVEALKSAYAIPDPASILIVDEAALVLADRRTDLKARSKALEGELNEVENAMRLLLGDQEIAQLPDGTVAFTWKGSPRRDINREALKADHPEIYEAYRQESTVRKLHVPKPKKEKQ